VRNIICDNDDDRADDSLSILFLAVYNKILVECCLHVFNPCELITSKNSVNSVKGRVDDELKVWRQL